MSRLTATHISRSQSSKSRNRRAVGKRQKRQTDAPAIHPLLQMQQTHGNRAVGRLIQAQLKVSQPGDKYEQEADRVAEQVVNSPGAMPSQSTSISGNTQGSSMQRMPEMEEGKSELKKPDEMAVPAISRMPEGEEDKELKKKPVEGKAEEEDMAPNLQTKPTAHASPLVKPSVASNINRMQGGGTRLPKPVRAYFEPRMGADFSQVRVHADAHAADTAKSINARAFTVGPNIAFGAGEYSPDTTAGRKLLAHELTHVVQQGDVVRRMPKDRFGRPLGFVPTPEQEEYDKETYVIELQKSMQTLIDGAVWKEIRKRVYPKESAAGIKRAKERKIGARPDLTGLGRLATLKNFVAAIKTLQGGWGPMSVNNRVKAIGAAVNVELTGVGVPPFLAVAKAKTEWKGFFQAGLWKFSISEALVSGGALSDADAAELCNTTLHEARHAEQHFLSARYSAGPPDNKSAAAIAAEQGIPEDPIAKAAVAAKFDAATDPKVAALGKEMFKAMVTEGAANQKISDDDYTAEMATARTESIASLASLKADATTATIADATAKRDKLKAAIAEVERRYTLYRNIPYEADAHEVGDAAEQAFKGWP